MASPLYNSRGTWSATVQYNYLDAVQYGKYTYICTGTGSLNQNPSLNAVVWVQMPVITQEDQYYLRSREDLLQYEDARYQSLINAMANFYTMRNDQSIWGSFLRAIAIELARIEYMYSYDIVAKNPQFLTPPDIKREYANPLFVTGNFQQLSQFDTGDFGASFAQWVGNTGMIARTAILDTNGNIQIAVIAGATAEVTPSWALNTSDTYGLNSVTTASGGNSIYSGNTSGFNNSLIGQPVLISGFNTTSNNGVFTVVASTTGSLTLNNSSGVAETNDAGVVVTNVTPDGTVVWTNGGPAPATLAYPIGYRDMLVDLLAAYQLGATTVSIQDVIYAYTGKNIVVEELYKEIVPGGFYDQSDRNAIKVSVNVGGDNPLVDVESLTELQQITNSLYGAIDLAKPAHVGLEFTTIFGADENIDCFISPRYLTQYQLNTLAAAQQQYYVLIANVLSQLTVSGWRPNTLYALGSTIQDSNGNIQLAIQGGVSNVTAPVWGTSVGEVVAEDNTDSPPQVATIWKNIVTPPRWNSTIAYNVGDVVLASNGLWYIAVTAGTNQSPLNVWGTWFGATQYSYLNLVQYNGVTYSCIASVGSLNQRPDLTPSVWAFSTTYWNPLPEDAAPYVSLNQYQNATTPVVLPSYLQAYYQNLNCKGTGIQDTLRIIIQQYEEPPFDPMLYQAPIEISTNPTTTLAAYGRRLLSPISAANWATLQAMPVVWNSSVTYPKGSLVRGLSPMSPGSFNAGVWTPGGWQLYRAVKKNTNQAVSNTTYWTVLPSPSIYQAYYKAQNGQYVIGVLQWTPNSAFYIGQFMIDNAGNLQLAVSTSGSGLSSLVLSVATTSGALQVTNSGGVSTLTVTFTTGVAQMGLVAHVSQITLVGFTFQTWINGLTLPVTSFSTVNNTISMTLPTFVNSQTYSQTELSATGRIAFSTNTTTPTYDGGILWQCLGLNGYTNPAKWVQVVGSNNNVTGEVANWDVTHPMGLLAPRTDLVWEISGGDIFNSYEME